MSEHTGGHTAPNPDRGEETVSQRGYPVDPHRVVRILLANRWWIVAAAVVGLGLGYLTAKSMGSTYKSSTALRFEGFPDVFGLSNADNPSLTTLVDAVHAQPVLEAVKKEMGYKHPTATIDKRIESVTDPIYGTIKFTVSADSAEGAQKFAKVLTDQFFDYQRNLQRTRLETARDGAAARLASVTQQYDTARKAFDAFREEHGISNLSTDTIERINRRAKLTADKDLAETRAEALRARIDSLQQMEAAAPRAPSR